jgi:hypothetical protein
MGDTTTTPPRWLEYVPVDDLPDHPDNPRTHDLTDLIDSVLRFGFTSPPLIDGRTGLLAEGHGRKKATIALRDGGPPAGWEGAWPPEGVTVQEGTWYVPVIHGWASTDDAEARAYLLAGNQGGGWDNDPLAAILRELHESDRGLTGTGFDDADMDLVLSELALAAGEGGQDPDTEWSAAGMPEYNARDLQSKWHVVVHCPTAEDYERLLKLLGSPVVRQASCWWPRSDGHIGEDWTKEWVTAETPPVSAS